MQIVQLCRPPSLALITRKMNAPLPGLSPVSAVWKLAMLGTRGRLVKTLAKFVSTTAPAIAFTLPAEEGHSSFCFAAGDKNKSQRKDIALAKRMAKEA